MSAPACTPKRPARGMRVEIMPHRIIGNVVGVRDSMRSGFWWLDILPETAMSPAETERNVYSGNVWYVPKGGERSPVSPVGEVRSAF